MTRSADLLVAAGSAEAEHRVSGSRFIAITRPVSSLAGAAAAREAERRRFHDATHHVFAGRLAGGDARFDDDGEPSGTGGHPVLRAIESTGLRDVVVVVTRYYGGTKLGTGGLARAYGAVAAEALALTPSRRMVHGRRLSLTFGYEDTGIVSRLLDRAGAVRLEEVYGDDVVLEIALSAPQTEQFVRELVDSTAGRAVVVVRAGEMLLPLDT